MQIDFNQEPRPPFLKTYSTKEFIYFYILTQANLYFKPPMVSNGFSLFSLAFELDCKILQEYTWESVLGWGQAKQIKMWTLLHRVRSVSLSLLVLICIVKQSKILLALGGDGTRRHAVFFKVALI